MVYMYMLCFYSSAHNMHTYTQSVVYIYFIIFLNIYSNIIFIPWKPKYIYFKFLLNTFVSGDELSNCLSVTITSTCWSLYCGSRQRNNIFNNNMVDEHLLALIKGRNEDSVWNVIYMNLNPASVEVQHEHGSKFGSIQGHCDWKLQTHCLFLSPLLFSYLCLTERSEFECFWCCFCTHWSCSVEA